MALSMVAHPRWCADCHGSFVDHGHVWRDAWAWSELCLAYLARCFRRTLGTFDFPILQSLKSAAAAIWPATSTTVQGFEHEEVERFDGFQGIAAWALAVVIGALLTAIVAMATNRPSPLTTPPSATEPSALSYEIDTLFRTTRRPTNVDLAPLRAEAGRILLTSSSHNGVSTDDRAYLGQMVTAVTGLTAPDADRRVDTVIGDFRKAISRARAAGIILAFSVAASLMFGAVAASAGAAAGGRHRDGMVLSGWMLHANRFRSRRSGWRRPSIRSPISGEPVRKSEE